MDRTATEDPGRPEWAQPAGRGFPVIISSNFAPAVAVNLLEYFQCRLGIRTDYAEEPSPLTNGWETYSYRFRLAPRPGLPAEYTRPLVLRLYASRQGLPRLRHEFAAQRHMVGLNYPVARPLLLEEDSSLFEGPFMIMEAVPGQILVELLFKRPWRLWGAPAQMADVHARLHRLPPEGFPTSPGPFLRRHLGAMRAMIDEFRLQGMSPGLEWLEDHRPGEPESPSIIHLDFHPLNLLFHEDRCSGLLDWPESDVGDRHADIAKTIVLFKSAPVETPTLWRRLGLLPGRGLLYRRYLRAYRRQLPLDERRLAYYVAWAAFQRLCCWGKWLRAGPSSTGCKPSSMRYLSAHRVACLGGLFRQWSGVEVRLGAADGRSEAAGACGMA